MLHDEIVGGYEMRTSFDHIVHAADQLDKRKTWMLDSKNRGSLLEKLSLKDDTIKHIHTCIAIGNRVFNGYTCGDHPVR